MHHDTRTLPPWLAAGIVLMLMLVRLMWSLAAQRRLSVITRTITQVH